MSSQLIDHSAEIAAAIREAFLNGTVYGRGLDHKLTCDEVLVAMFAQRILSFIDIIGEEGWLTKDVIVTINGARSLKEAGVKRLSDLQYWTPARLSGLPHIGPVGVRQIERELARHGLGLKGSTPERIERLQREPEQAEAPEVDRWTPSGTPEEMHMETAQGLVTLGQRFLSAGSSLMNSAIRVQSEKRPLCTARRHISDRRDGWREVAAIIEPLERLEAQRKGVPFRRRTDETTDNVVELAPAEQPAIN